MALPQHQVHEELQNTSSYHRARFGATWPVAHDGEQATSQRRRRNTENKYKRAETSAMGVHHAERDQSLEI